MNLLCCRLGGSALEMHESNTPGLPQITTRSGPSAPSTLWTTDRLRSLPSTTPSTTTPRRCAAISALPIGCWFQSRIANVRCAPGGVASMRLIAWFSSERSGPGIGPGSWKTVL